MTSERTGPSASPDDPASSLSCGQRRATKRVLDLANSVSDDLSTGNRSATPGSAAPEDRDAALPVVLEAALASLDRSRLLTLEEFLAR